MCEGVFYVLDDLKAFILDESGAVITTEKVIYILFGAGMAAAVGYGLSGAYRGLTGSIVQNIQDADPNP